MVPVLKQCSEQRMYCVRARHTGGAEWFVGYYASPALDGRVIHFEVGHGIYARKYRLFPRLAYGVFAAEGARAHMEQMRL